LKLKNEGGKKLFTAQEIHDLLNGKTIADKVGKSVVVPAASPQMRAMILLGINAGLGNSDIGNLQRAHLDLKSGWLDYPRVKTGLPRRVPLWAETVTALRDSITERPSPKNPGKDAGCVFLNRLGSRFVQSTEKCHVDYVTTSFGKRLRQLKINHRKGLNFYSVRHTFATIALQTGDRDAVKALMGHAFHDILSAYDETGPSDDRLLAVVEHVRKWLFGSTRVTRGGLSGRRCDVGKSRDAICQQGGAFNACSIRRLI
jgi:integrase